MLEEIFKKLGGKSFDEYVSSLNGDELRDFLIFINAKVREIELEEGGLFQDEGRYLEDGTYLEYRMNVGGELIAPRKEVQDRSFEKMAAMLKNVRNNQHKAIVMYTLINYLHLFRDGNGRTSRMVYDLLSGNIKGEQDAQFYIHEKDKKVGQRNPWEDVRKVQKPRVVSTIASEFLMKYLLNEGVISSAHEDLSTHIQIKTICAGESKGIYISDENKSQLSRKTLEHLKQALKDNNEAISASALSMLIILTQKGKLQPLKNYYFNKEFEVDNGLVRNGINIGNSRDDEDLELFDEYPEDSAKRTFRGWTPEDYLKLIDITDKMKECLIDLIIDFAERPESFKYNQSGKSVIDALMGEKILQDRCGVEIYHAPFKVDKQSRVYGSIAQIRGILDKPRTCDEEKLLIDTYEKGKIKSSDLSKARKIIVDTLEQTKQKDSEEMEWLM